MDPQLQHADTVPGFTMQSEGFYLKFVTGLQCGVSSKLLEYETDWYEVMEILLSRLQDEPENKERFEIIASRDLEYWARIQPGGDTLNLKIRVSLEEKRYHLPPNGTRKNLRLIFNDRFSTEVIFYARKKMLLKSLKDLAAVGVADHFSSEDAILKLGGEIPNSLIPNVQKAFQNCWTARFWRTKIVPCPYWCICKAKKKTPLGLSENKTKTPTNTRRQLLYKRVADKHVRTAQNKKVVKKKVESKNTKQAKGSNKKGKEIVEKIKGKGNQRKQDHNLAKKSSKKLPVSKSVDLAKTKTGPNSNSTQKKSTVDPKHNSSRGKTPLSMDKRSTPGVKKNDFKKTVDNVKVLKDKVKAMKNKLKILMEAVAVSTRAKGKSGSKKKNATNTSPKRNVSKRNSPLDNPENPVKKRKVDVKNKSQKSSKEDIFSPRPTRRSAGPIVKTSNSRESKSKSKNESIKSKSSKRKSCDSDAKFTKSTSNATKFTKSPKKKIQRASPRSMPRNKSKSNKTESKLQNPKQLKRSLRSQSQVVPNKKRRQG